MGWLILTRRIAEHPAMDFATAGFPRERTWQKSWQLECQPIDSMKMLAPKVNHPVLTKAKRWRRTHVLGLFGILPLHVARTLAIASTLEREPWASKVHLPTRLRDELRIGQPSCLKMRLKSSLLPVGEGDHLRRPRCALGRSAPTLPLGKPDAPLRVRRSSHR